MKKLWNDEEGMKEEELRKNAVCSWCGKKIGHTGIPFFWTLSIDRWGLDKGALDRNKGLAQFFNGNALLARVMGPDEDMAHKMIDTVHLTICEDCIDKPLILLALADKSEEVKHDNL
jgi:hypothetical protein